MVGILSNVKVGDELPEFRRTTGFALWNRYAAVNDEFVPIHMDDEAGRAAGMPGAIGMGNLQWSFLHNVIREWLGDSGRIVAVSCQFRSPNLKDQVVVASGRVIDVAETPSGLQVSLDVWTSDEEGNQLAPGTGTVIVTT